MRKLEAIMFGAVLFSASACGGAAGKKGETCDPASEEPCEGSLVCATVDSGERQCHAPVLLRGQVSSSADRSAIAGAQVIALDGESTAVSDVAVTGADGTYEVQVPAVRDAEGKPKGPSFRLRASAADHQTFPGGVRTALPIDAATAVLEEERFVIDNPLTDVQLIELPEAERGRASLMGSVDAPDAAGVLVVAEGAATESAVADKDGSFTIFNVAPGAYTLRGYAQGLQLEAASVTVAGEDVAGIALVASSTGVVPVSGTIQIVNAQGGLTTSVVFVVDATYAESFERGEVPRGLRAPNVSGAWRIEGVPAGRYVVLAAFENDGLVRDPDENIAGTGIVRIDVPAGGAEVTVGTSFKITEALPVVAPGRDAPEAVAAAPMLTFGDDSSEDFYEVVVHDAFGNEVWRKENIEAVSGGGDVVVPYEGPLEEGQYYQFRAVSYRASGRGDASPIAATEDLRGVFFKPAP